MHIARYPGNVFQAHRSHRLGVTFYSFVRLPFRIKVQLNTFTTVTRMIQYVLYTVQGWRLIFLFCLLCVFRRVVQLPRLQLADYP